jgi:hypothetical protein
MKTLACVALIFCSFAVSVFHEPMNIPHKICIKSVTKCHHFQSSCKPKKYRCRMTSSGMLRRVALVRTDVSEETSAFIIKVTRIGELGTMLAVTSNRRTKFLLNVNSYKSHTA